MNGTQLAFVRTWSGPPNEVYFAELNRLGQAGSRLDRPPSVESLGADDTGKHGKSERPSTAPDAAWNRAPDAFVASPPSPESTRSAGRLPLDAAALHGLTGEIVRAIEPYSEADPVGLLAHTVVGIGALVGSACYALAGDARHPARLYAVVVGITGRSRKGSALRPIERLLALVDRPFAETAIVEGLSSGEGLIWRVRDPIEKIEQVGKGADRHPESVIVDPGIADKRLFVVEAEFSSPLIVAQREGNTLSAVIRRAWDGSTLQTLTKTSPATATGAHISIVGHITREELLRHLDRTELANGFANRFLWFQVGRAKYLPHGEAVPEALLRSLAEKIAQVADWARSERVIRRDAEATAIWESIYPTLVEGRPGLLGSITSRADAQVLRLSVFYAVVDQSSVVRAEHLLAALAVWRVADQSAEAIFSDAVGDPVADAILVALRRSGELTRTDISNLFSRHADRGRIEGALTSLRVGGLAEQSARETGGRPQEVWRALSSHSSLDSPQSGET